MTLQEFTAWLDGFGEAIGDAPTPEQWAKVKGKFATIYPLPNSGLTPIRPHYPAMPGYPLPTLGPSIQPGPHTSDYRPFTIIHSTDKVNGCVLPPTSKRLVFKN